MSMPGQTTLPTCDLPVIRYDGATILDFYVVKHGLDSLNELGRMAGLSKAFYELVSHSDVAWKNTARNMKRKLTQTQANAILHLSRKDLANTPRQVISLGYGYTRRTAYLFDPVVLVNLSLNKYKNAEGLAKKRKARVKHKATLAATRARKDDEEMVESLWFDQFGDKYDDIKDSHVNHELKNARKWGVWLKRGEMDNLHRAAEEHAREALMHKFGDRDPPPSLRARYAHLIPNTESRRAHGAVTGKQQQQQPLAKHREASEQGGGEAPAPTKRKKKRKRKRNKLSSKEEGVGDKTKPPAANETTGRKLPSKEEGKGGDKLVKTPTPKNTGARGGKRKLPPKPKQEEWDLEEQEPETQTQAPLLPTPLLPTPLLPSPVAPNPLLSSPIAPQPTLLPRPLLPSPTPPHPTAPQSLLPSPLLPSHTAPHHAAPQSLPPTAPPAHCTNTK
uniref:Uncharacterized protein n=1 Tax=Rhizochromulina marina TaxID=1034831 RepID=A0A7S2W3R9_9STRA|mmetsp:Transcript_12879/g.37448  ORF Transcript_12879/g.37448 Transcript_12879/m.37448 type:complete len:447 (+) Transcript_12879:74-1414(+)